MAAVGATTIRLFDPDEARAAAHAAGSASTVEAMDSLTLLRRAGDFYDRRLAAVTADQWSMPSICDGWSVKDLADHVLGGNRFAALDGDTSVVTVFHTP